MNPNDYFLYDPQSGIVTWKVNHNHMRAGDRAGTKKRDGYRYISVSGTRMLEHRMAWFIVYGEWPYPSIDHINMIKSDNRLCNLRIATVGENNQNRQKQSNNTSGYKGVSLNKKTKKYQARIMYNKIGVSLGNYDSAEEAAEAYQTAAKELHNEFARA